MRRAHERAWTQGCRTAASFNNRLNVHQGIRMLPCLRVLIASSSAWGSASWPPKPFALARFYLARFRSTSWYRCPQGLRTTPSFTLANRTVIINARQKTNAAPEPERSRRAVCCVTRQHTLHAKAARPHSAHWERIVASTTRHPTQQPHESLESSLGLCSQTCSGRLPSDGCIPLSEATRFDAASDISRLSLREFKQLK